MTILTFPSLAGLAFPVRKSPMMSTVVTRSISGKVNALQQMTYPLWNWKLPYNFLRAASANVEFQTLTTFFLQVGGRANTFQFNDVDDYVATAQAFGSGDGVSTDFQLVRALSAGGFSFVEPVFVPLTITQITIAGTPSGAYTLQPGGIIRFNSAPANGAALTWTGTYNWLVRFDADLYEFEKFAHQFWRLKEINFTSEPL